MRAEYLSKEPTLMEIVVGGCEIRSFVRHPAPLLCETGLIVKMNNYNLEGVILACLEDYGMEKFMEVVNSLRTDEELIYIPDPKTTKS